MSINYNAIQKEFDRVIEQTLRNTDIKVAHPLAGLRRAAPTCPYCGDVSEMVKGDVIYPHRPDLYKLTFYRCDPCDAHVGTHKGTITPLGRLANAALRKAKSDAHKAFDPIWRGGYMSRKQAYLWLSQQLGIDVDDCHIAMFDIDACRRVERICLDYVR